ncbi:unnamed protein product [Urochloa humidicola]
MDVPEPSCIHESRCITSCKGKIRFIEIMPHSATISMWTLKEVGWEMKYEEKLEGIWESKSYRKAWMPKEVPVLVLVSPLDPELIYFTLEQRIFGVNVCSHEVLEFTEEAHNLIGPSMADIGLVPLPTCLGASLSAC